MKAARQTKRDAEQLWRFCKTDGTIDEDRARRVVDEVVGSHRGRGPAVLKQFLRLVRLDRDRRTARIESAAPLDDRTRASVLGWLTRKYGATITPTFAVTPDLLGGVRVQIGSDVYDGTVRGELDALDKRF